MPKPVVDIRENDLLSQYPDVLAQLLRDHTTGRNIIWGTNDYSHFGEGYGFADEITIEHITGTSGNVIQPRVVKSHQQQTDRSKGMAEVFTPSWVCNAQNNLVDEAWFGRENVFNTEYTEGTAHCWKPNPNKIGFPEGKTWKDYVRATRMEITCGEAPYLVSRYDTTTGHFIPLPERIGILDRKLRIVSENTSTSGEWLKWAQQAYQHTYGYEWQGDNLLLAREAMLHSFIEYYEAKFGKHPLLKSITYIAYIISWNLWQMDGLKGVVPDSCHSESTSVEQGLFGEEIKIQTSKPCEGCLQDNIHRHNGQYCLIRDWANDKKIIRFVDLIKPI